jgi:hypothetical protein
VTQSAIACILEAIKSIRCATREAYGQVLKLVSGRNRLGRFNGVTWRARATAGAIEGERAGKQQRIRCLRFEGGRGRCIRSERDACELLFKPCSGAASQSTPYGSRSMVRVDVGWLGSGQAGANKSATEKNPRGDRPHLERFIAQLLFSRFTHAARVNAVARMQ